MPPRVQYGEDRDRLPTSDLALREAISTINNLFHTPDQLGRTAIIKSKFDRARRQINNMVNTLSRSYVEDIKLSFDLFSQSTDAIDTIQYKAVLTDQLASQALGSIPLYSTLYTINIAKMNIEMTKRILSDIYLLEQSSQTLLYYLTSNDTSIQHVYKLARRLDKIRFHAALQCHRLRPATMEELVRLFQCVVRLNHTLNQVIWNNIQDSLVLAEDSPEILVLTLEIIELEDNAINKYLSLDRLNDIPLYRENLAILRNVLKKKAGQSTGFESITGNDDDDNDNNNNNISHTTTLSAHMSHVQFTKYTPEFLEQYSRYTYIDADLLFYLGGLQYPNQRLPRHVLGYPEDAHSKGYTSLKEKVLHVLRDDIADIFSSLILTPQQRQERREKRKQEEEARLAEVRLAQDNRMNQRNEMKRKRQEEKQAQKNKVLNDQRKKVEAIQRTTSFVDSKNTSRSSAQYEIGQIDDILDDDGFFSDDDDDDDSYDDMSQSRDDFDDDDDFYSDEDEDYDDDGDNSYDDGFNDDDDDDFYSDEDDSYRHKQHKQPKSKSKNHKEPKPSQKTAKSPPSQNKGNKSTTNSKPSNNQPQRGGGGGGGSGGKQQTTTNKNSNSYDDDDDDFASDSYDDKRTGGLFQHNNNDDTDDDHDSLIDDFMSPGNKTAKKSSKLNKNNSSSTLSGHSDDNDDHTDGNDNNDDDGDDEDDSNTDDIDDGLVPLYTPTAPDEPDSLSEILDKLREYLLDLHSVKTNLVPCFPQHYHIEELYVQQYLKWFRTVIAVNIPDFSQLTKSNLLLLILFTNDLLNQSHIYFFTGEDLEYYERLMSELMVLYVQAGKAVLFPLITNLLVHHERAIPQEDPNGYLLTTASQDLLSIISQQISINISVGLRGKAFYFVGLMVVEAINFFQDRLLAFTRSLQISPVKDNNNTNKNTTNNSSPVIVKFLFGDRHVEQNLDYFCALLNNCTLGADNTTQICSDICKLIRKTTQQQQQQQQQNKQDNNNAQVQRQLNKATSEGKNVTGSRYTARVGDDTLEFDDIDSSDDENIASLYDNGGTITGSGNNKYDTLDNNNDQDEDYDDDDDADINTTDDPNAYSINQLCTRLTVLFDTVIDRFDTISIQCIDNCVLMSIARIATYLKNNAFTSQWISNSRNISLPMIKMLSNDIDSFDAHLFSDAHFTRVLGYLLSAVVVYYTTEFIRFMTNNTTLIFRTIDTIDATTKKAKAAKEAAKAKKDGSKDGSKLKSMFGFGGSKDKDQDNTTSKKKKVASKRNLGQIDSLGGDDSSFDLFNFDTNSHVLDTSSDDDNEKSIFNNKKNKSKQNNDDDRYDDDFFRSIHDPDDDDDNSSDEDEDPPHLIYLRRILILDRDALYGVFSSYTQQLGGQYALDREFSKFDILIELLSGQAEWIGSHFSSVVDTFGPMSQDVFNSIMAIRREMTKQDRQEITAEWQECRDLDIYRSSLAGGPSSSSDRGHNRQDTVALMLARVNGTNQQNSTSSNGTSSGDTQQSGWFSLFNIFKSSSNGLYPNIPRTSMASLLNLFAPAIIPYPYIASSHLVFAGYDISHRSYISLSSSSSSTGVWLPSPTVTTTNLSSLSSSQCKQLAFTSALIASLSQSRDTSDIYSTLSHYSKPNFDISQLPTFTNPTGPLPSHLVPSSWPSSAIPSGGRAKYLTPYGFIFIVSFDDIESIQQLSLTSGGSVILVPPPLLTPVRPGTLPLITAEPTVPVLASDTLYSTLDLMSGTKTKTKYPPSPSTPVPQCLDSAAAQTTPLSSFFSRGVFVATPGGPFVLKLKDDIITTTLPSFESHSNPEPSTSSSSTSGKSASLAGGALPDTSQASAEISASLTTLPIPQYYNSMSVLTAVFITNNGDIVGWRQTLPVGAQTGQDNRSAAPKAVVQLDGSTALSMDDFLD